MSTTDATARSRKFAFAFVAHISIELVVLNDFNAVPFSTLTSNQAADMIRVAAQRPMDRSAASELLLLAIADL